MAGVGKPTYVKKTEGKEAMQKPSMEQLKKVGKLAGKMISFLSEVRETFKELSLLSTSWDHIVAVGDYLTLSILRKGK